MLRSAPVSNAELAVSGGDERLRYRLSGTWFDQNGIVIHSGYRRVGGRLNLDFNPASRLSFSTSLAFSGDHNDRIENDGSDKGIITNAVGNSPLIPIRRRHRRFHRARPSSSTSIRWPWPLSTTVRARTNSLWATSRRGSGSPTGLQFTSRLGIDLVNLREDQFESRLVAGTLRLERGRRGQERLHPGQPLRDRQLRSPCRPTWATGPSSTPPRAAAWSSTGASSTSSAARASATTSSPRCATPRCMVEGDGHQLEEQPGLVLRPGAVHARPEIHLGGSLRTDGSQPVRPQQPLGPLPGGLGRWVLSEESFLQGSFFDYLKLRASYGLTGNQAISDFPYQGLFGSANYGDTPGSAPSNLANPDLKWETTKQFDIGTGPGLRPRPGQPDRGLLPQEDQRPAARPADLGHLRLHQRVRQRRQHAEQGLSSSASPR